MFRLIADAAKGVPACATVIAAAISVAGKLGSMAVIFKSPLVKTGVPVLEAVLPAVAVGIKVALVIARPVASTILSDPVVLLGGVPAPTQETEISVAPLSSRRNLLSIAAAKDAPVAESGARLLTVIVLPPKFIPNDAKSPAAAGVLKLTVGKVAEVGTWATYLAPKSELAFNALASAAVVNSLVASTGTDTVVFAPVGPNVSVTESVGTPLVLNE